MLQGIVYKLDEKKNTLQFQLHQICQRTNLRQCHNPGFHYCHTVLQSRTPYLGHHKPEKLGTNQLDWRSHISTEKWYDWKVTLKR